MKKKSGSYGDVGCFSAHPLKNLNAMGDSGYLTTNSKKISELVKSLRSHGMTNRNIVNNFGYVSRMDNLQAAILNFRLKNLKNIIEKEEEMQVYILNTWIKIISTLQKKIIRNLILITHLLFKLIIEIN